jgi:inosine-uridine nucleoside N-ribohydrolase
MMGGAFFCSGNVTPHAEFNIWFNAEAAQTVFDSRDDIVVMPLDVTRHLIFTRDMTKNFKGGTRHVIYPWNQSQIENRKSSSPRIYPWSQSKI